MGDWARPPRHMRPGNRQQRRALHTGSKAWRKLRAHILERDMFLCRVCKKFGDHVDHIDGNAHNNDPSNLQTLCIFCHSRKTAQEDKGFGNKPSHKAAFDEQGNPIGQHTWNE